MIDCKDCGYSQILQSRVTLGSSSRALSTDQNYDGDEDEEKKFIRMAPIKTCQCGVCVEFLELC